METGRRRAVRAMLVAAHGRSREALIAALERGGDFEVSVAVASFAQARARDESSVDVIVVMNGDDRATTIGLPVVVVGDVPIEGAPAGVAYVAAPGTNWQLASGSELLAARIRQASRELLRRSSATMARVAPKLRFTPGQVIAIAASTGGTEAVLQVLKALPADCPPVLIVQHIPAAFSAGFARRLHELTPLDVREARNGETLAPGMARLAPGDLHLAIDAVDCGFVTRIFHGERVHNVRPAADVLMRAVARAARANAVGVVLTGMGEDGAAGLLAMREAGARTIAESELTCAVFGMPRQAIERGAAERTVQLPAIGGAIVACLRQESLETSSRTFAAVRP